MKKLVILGSVILLSISMFIISCEKNTEISESTADGFVKMNLPKNFASSETKQASVFIPLDDRIHEHDFFIELNGEIIEGKQIVELDESGNVVSIQISEDFLKKTKLDADFLNKYQEGMKSGCDCDDAKRPGWCRTGCVIEVVVKVAIAVAAFL